MYSIPIRAPICSISEIWATQGVTREINAPEKKPYREEKSIIETRDLAKSQKTTQERPEKNAEGVRRLNLPTLSERTAGAMRPSTPPAFMTAST